MQSVVVSTFNTFDWLLITVLAISTVTAFFRGMIKVLFSLAGLILGIFLAGWYYLSLASRLRPFIPSLPAAQVVSFIVIAMGVMVVCSLLATILRKAVSAVGLGIFDRLLGAAFGLLRGLLLGVAIMMALLAFLPNAPWLKHSTLAPYFIAGAHAVCFVVPQHLQQQITTGATHLLQRSPELFRSHTSGRDPHH